MRVLADFNEVYEERYVWAIVPTIDTVAPEGHFPRIGEWVELYDYDGTSCLGMVKDCTEDTIDCEIDWDTVRYSTQDVPATFDVGYPFGRVETSSEPELQIA